MRLIYKWYGIPGVGYVEGGGCVPFAAKENKNILLNTLYSSSHIIWLYAQIDFSFSLFF